MEVDSLQMKGGKDHFKPSGKHTPRGKRQTHKSCHTVPYKADQKPTWSRGRGRGRGGCKAHNRKQEPECQCKKCDGRHGLLSHCPPYGKQCHVCNGWGHFSKVCRRGQGTAEMNTVTVAKTASQERYSLLLPNN